MAAGMPIFDDDTRFRYGRG